MTLRVSTLVLADDVGDFVTERTALQALSLTEAVKQFGIRACMRNDDWYAAIVDLHREIVSEELPMFWRACQLFKSTTSRSERASRARAINEMYVREGSSSEINVMQRTRRQVATRVKRLGISDAADARIFDQAQAEGALPHSLHSRAHYESLIHISSSAHWQQLWHAR